jgi:four helix bundle protein
MRPHHRLEAWKIVMKPVSDVYAASRGFPKEEACGLTSQVRRSAISIPSKIAEGAARNGEKEFVQFIAWPRAR